MVSLKTLARRGVGLFNLKKAPVRFRIARAWLDQYIRRSSLYTPNSLPLDLEHAGLNFATWHKRAATSARLPHSLKTEQIEIIRTRDPQRIEACVLDAETVMRHEFNLLGSGPYRPTCPSRPVTAGGYAPIDWALDPIRQLRFKEGFSHLTWELYRDRPGNADVKFPWELARCQHFLQLAQAWICTKNPKYAQEILSQISDFNEANSAGIGVNWTCTMDVGLRAASWAIALDLINDCRDLDRDALYAAYAALYDHGEFIRANLENISETTSNHYLSNVVGLFYVGAMFRDLAAGRSWLRFASKCVEHEIAVQVLPDGADFESSIPYHRLVIELFLAGYRLSQHIGRPFGPKFHNAFVGMIEYMTGVLTPRGEMPCLGDADDGRFMIATDYCSWRRPDPRHLLAPCAILCERDDWKEISPRGSAWEAVWWGLDVTSFVPGDQAPGDNCQLYPYAGVAVSRRRDDGQYLLVENSIVGTHGFGNHKHNDQLSFEYHDRGTPLIVDPGSYVYTSDFDARNLFRSTAYHNTLQVDGREQNEFKPEWLFRLFEKANPEHLKFEVSDGLAVYEGRYSGLSDDAEGASHWRRFTHDMNRAELAIVDRLSGNEHALTWNFHLHPAVEATLDARSVTLKSGCHAWRLSWSHADLTPQLRDTWYSPSYGVREPTKSLRLSRTKLPSAGIEWRFELKRLAG